MANNLGVVMDSEVGVPNGVAPLGADNIVPEEHLPSTINDIKTDTEEIKADTGQLKTDAAALKADASQLKADATTLKADTAKLKEDTSALKEDTGTLKADTTTLKEDTGTLKTDTTALKADTASLKSELATVKAGVQTLLAERPIRYGFKRSATDSNPSTRITYLYDAVGKIPAKMGAESFTYGDWASAWFVEGNYPVMLNANGTEAYRLNPNDYTKRADTGADSAIEDEEGTLNAMAAFPLVYIKRYMEGKDECVVFSNVKYDSSYKAYAHTDSIGRIKPVCYHAIYKGSLDSGSKVRSLSGKRPWQTTGGFDTERTNVKKNGANWEIRTWAFQTMLADELTLISKTDDSQTAFGQGNTTSGTGAEHELDTGTLNTKGQFWGDTVGTTSQVKVFHIEGFWGDRWDRLAGLIQQGGSYMVKMTAENGGYNATGQGYDAFPVGIGQVVASGNGGQKDTYTCDLGTLPHGATFTGTATTYTCDWFWWNTGITAVAVAGGSCTNAARCGSRLVIVIYAASRSPWNIGPSLFWV